MRQLIIARKDLQMSPGKLAAQCGHIRYLHPGEAPRAVFELGDETPVAVYAYCNLHGLWTTKL